MAKRTHSLDMPPQSPAFTLIELLIVVAIIAILAAIAVPNFLQAQVRAKVSSVKSDQRALGVAIEAYAVDNGNYPDSWRWEALGGRPGIGAYVQYVWELTTPIAYITSVQRPDPFRPVRETGVFWQLDPDWIGSFVYWNYQGLDGRRAYQHIPFSPKAWVLSSFGPDRNIDYMERFPYFLLYDVSPAGDGWPYAPERPIDILYDPTNGTVSNGDIGRCGGELPLPAILGG
ncbi:MAG TPA: prepilin-type N-terminal cleavage/methylation domain-containing protein [Sumerlaeia bacterium]|nr:prepilin-type N-terminal cleavage/methylation domain-containing protein [Sumerlaeia bacterium]